jgi:LPS export ABC transporter permease LptG/LPS export ABC transporter permease LptF
MPRILDRYVWAELLAPFGMGLAVFTFFLFIDRVYQLTDLVITKGVAFHLVLGLLGYMLPAFLAVTLPMALLVAVLLAGGRLAGDLEITALKACGVSPLRLFRPFLVAGLAVTLATAGLTLAVTPWASGGFQRQLFRILQTRATTGIQERTFSASFGQFTVYVQEVSPSQVALKGLLVADERDPTVSRVIVAREGRLLTDEAQKRIVLRFLDGQIAEADVGDARRSRYTAFSIYDMSLPLESPFNPGRLDKPERDLGLRELLRQARSLQAEGQIATPYWVELHKRFALPVAVLVFTVVGFPLGIRMQGGGRAAALAVSLAIVVGYYLVFTFLEGLANRGRLPPAVALWLPNAVFGAAGAVLLLGAARERRAAWAAGWWWRLQAHLPRRDAGRRAGAARPPWRAPRASTYIIDRYLLREYATYLGLGLAVGAVLFVVVDLLQTLDRFLRNKPPLLYILQHFALRLPGALYEGLPLVVLMATVFLFGALTRQRELDAFKAAGISLYRLSLPILALAGVLSVGAVAFQETLLPAINARADEVDRVKIKGALPRHLQKRSQIWYRTSDTRFLRLELLDPVAQVLDGLLVLEVDGSFRLTSRLDARQARWTGRGWVLTDAVQREYGPDHRVTSAALPAGAVDMPEHIDDLTQVQRPPETMSFLELRAYIARLQESGHRITKYVVELYGKLSFPLVHVVMALVGIPFALVSPRSGGRTVAIAVAVAISVGYWVVHYIALAFAKADLLPPLLAAWTANVVFAGLGTALLLRART